MIKLQSFGPLKSQNILNMWFRKHDTMQCGWSGLNLAVRNSFQKRDIHFYKTSKSEFLVIPSLEENLWCKEKQAVQTEQAKLPFYILPSTSNKVWYLFMDMRA
jgi:hypothetical protein